MVSRLGLGLFCVALAISTPAVAAVAFDCSFTTFDGPPGVPAHVAIQISGDDLAWILDPFDIPIPKMHISPPTLHYRILENNDVGIVAVSTQSRIDKDVGAVISAEVVTINKADGALHSGAVGANGVHDVLNGKCQQK